MVRSAVYKWLKQLLRAKQFVFLAAVTLFIIASMGKTSRTFLKSVFLKHSTATSRSLTFFARLSVIPLPRFLESFK